MKLTFPYQKFGSSDFNPFLNPHILKIRKTHEFVKFFFP